MEIKELSSNKREEEVMPRLKSQTRKTVIASYSALELILRSITFMYLHEILYALFYDIPLYKVRLIC
jgi:hypothetical protein